MIPFGLSSLMTVSMPIGRRATKCLVPGATAVYLCNEGAGTVLTDFSGNALDGTLGAAGAAPSWGATGLTFETDDKVTFPAITYPGAFTATWAGNHPTEGSIDIVLADATDATNKIGYNSSGGSVYLRVGNTTAAGAASPKYTPGTWHTITITRSAAGVVSGYANTTAYPGIFTDTDSVILSLLGNDSAGNCAEATIGAALLYPFELASTQVAQNHAALRGILAPRGVTLA